MDRKNVMESIANSITAVAKIRDLRNSTLKNDGDSSVKPSITYVYGEMLKTVAEYSPGRHGDALRKSVELGNLYSNTYKDLRNYLSSTRSGKTDPARIVKTLAIVKPVLPNRHKTIIDKIQKIYEIINS
jgi:hypothetical protein